MNRGDGSRRNSLTSLMRFFYESNSRDSRTVLKKPEEEVAAVRIDCQNTLKGLAGSTVTCPPVDAALLSAYFKYFVESGFLPAPSHSTRVISQVGKVRPVPASS